MHINDSLEEVKALISGISEDALKVLSMVQMTVPAAEAVINRIVLRAEQVAGLFSSQEEEHGDA